MSDARTLPLTRRASELAADEVDGLDAVGAFVDRRDAGVAEMLGGAGLLDEAHAAVHLDAERRDLDAEIGPPRLDDRREQVGELAARRSPPRRRRRWPRSIGRGRRSKQRPHRLGQRPHRAAACAARRDGRRSATWAARRAGALALHALARVVRRACW